MNVTGPRKRTLLKKIVSNMSATIESLKGCLDRQEQYSRKNCSLIHGVLKPKHENTFEWRRWEKR